MKSVIGILCGNGLLLDDVLRMSWEQINLVAESIALNKAQTFNAYATPIAEALGVKGSNKKKSPKRRTGNGKDKAKEKDQQLIMKIRAAGFDITE